MKTYSHLTALHCIMALLHVFLVVCTVLCTSFSTAEEKQRETCKEVANQPSFVEDYHDACFKGSADKLEKPKGWHHTCAVRMIHGKGSVITSAMTKLTKIDVDYGDASPKEPPTTVKIGTMLRSAGKKGITVYLCHKDGTKIVELASAYNTTLPDEPFANLVRFSFPTPQLADCYKLKPLAEDPEEQRNHIITKTC